MHLSDASQGTDFFGSSFDATTGNVRSAELGGGGETAVLLGWGLLVDPGRWTCGRKPLSESSSLSAHDFR